MRLLVLSILFVLPLSASAQKTWKQRKQKISHAQGTLFLHWGYNRSGYTKSNIRFVGPGYDFTMGGADVHDNPSPFSFDKYLNPANFTIPQFNARVGYYFRHHWSISLGYDHMKYIFADGNQVSLSGSIDDGVDNSTNWSGIYNGQRIMTDRDLFHYENSNGLNYIRLELARTDMLISLGQKDQFAISTNAAVGAGALLSISDFKFAGQESLEIPSMSGYGLSGHLGLRFEFFKHIYLQSNFGGGFHHQVKVRTRQNDPSAFARHAYAYMEFNTVLGLILYIRPTNSCDSCPVW